MEVHAMFFSTVAKIYFALPLLASAIPTRDDTYTVSYRRTDNSNGINEITLSCINPNVQLPDAQYFRNKIPFNNVQRVDNGAFFIATRTTEGNFSCGIIEGNVFIMGPSVPIMALPGDSSITPNAEPSYGRIGSRVRLNCSIPPSQLFLSRYGVTWMNSSNVSDVFYRQRAGTPGIAKSSRYQLDPRSFALLVADIQPLDAVTSYLCVLSVTDTNSPEVLEFDRTRTLNLSIIVFAPPAFTLIPVPVTTAQSRRANVTFTCEVQSAPEPSRIIWFYSNGDVEVQVRESTQYHIENGTSGGAGTKITRSEVAVLTLDGFSSGEFRCEAQYVAFSANKEQILEKSSYSTTLAVLSRPSDVETIPTENGGFIFKITLVDALPIPVAVEIRFLDADSDSVMRSTQNDVFMNTNTITTYRESVPFTRFTMGVGVVYRSVHGPLLRDNIVHERSNSEEKVLIYKTLSVCEGVIIALLILIILAFLFVGFMERLLMNDDGYLAGDIIKKVNCRRRRNIIKTSMKHRTRQARKTSTTDLMPDGKIEGDSEEVESTMQTTEYGITDELATKYVEGLDLAMMFGRKDPKIKKLLHAKMEQNRNTTSGEEAVTNQSW